MRYEDSMKGVAAQIIKEQLRASKIKNNPEDFHWHDEYATLNFFRFICKNIGNLGNGEIEKMVTRLKSIDQKAVELGAYSVVPVSTRRCVVKLDNRKAEKKVSRWQQIAESAAKQSKRMLVPEVHSVMTFKEALAYAKELDVLLIPYELAKGMKETKELIQAIEPGKSIGVFIGPEGGFEEQEVADAMEAGAKPITLGHRILRTETAGLAVLSVLMFQLEDE